MGRTKPPYTPEFRSEAVRLARSSGRPLREIADDLGCSLESLRHWIKQTKIDAGEAQGLTTDEREELRRLRREGRTTVASQALGELSGKAASSHLASSRSGLIIWWMPAKRMSISSWTWCSTTGSLSAMCL